MAKMESEFDALDADLDTQLHEMLKPLPMEPGQEAEAEAGGDAQAEEGAN